MIFILKSVVAAVILLFFIFIPQNEVQSSLESDNVDKWAKTFGNELWDLAQRMTKSNEIKARYKTLNAQVQEKNGTLLIDDIVESIGRMLDKKKDAVECIALKSEIIADNFHRNGTLKANFEYYSSKYSMINLFNATNETDFQSYSSRKYTKYEEENVDMGRFLNLTLDRDSHFFDLYVDTTRSSVHVPTNVYDNGSEAKEFIQWSEQLNDIFDQNYKSDPALSWQYFGSNLGIMRHFPAMSWIRNKTDTYDCRKRSWYIETATCSKDVVILLDNSGSMTGYRSYIAEYTIRSLLDTFSNNDFINIFSYSDNVTELIKCFKDILVQATPENIDVFNDEVKNLIPTGYANVTVALEKAFQLLEKYRDIRKCSESKAGCNQAIMLVTDGVPGNATEIFERYNWYNNESRAYPVRIFTYLLGKEVTKVKEIQLYACMNRGFYSHIQSLDEVAEEVLKYVNVIAAPLVLQKEDHPPTWTHAYIDKTFDTEIDEKRLNIEQKSRMMIAVGVPAFNLSSYGEGNLTGRPKLLGVAGTDIPLDDINKLALPYKLGVNGYAFIVSNNGYVLLHPDLRPLYKDIDEDQDIIKRNYNSIDLTEVEQFEDDELPREPNETILKLREEMVHSRKGKIIGVPVKFHYDIMRRVEHSKQDYYYAPIPETPFSLGIALPHDYGNTWIKVGDEIQRNTYTKINISDFFVGENWKIHPDWVYCKYHYYENHEFNRPEEELRHFLKKIVEPNWKWSQQYEFDPDAEKEKANGELNCGGKSLDNEDYYCNKELVELLVFDAKVTNDSYQSFTFKNDAEREIIELYNATVRFVSTMSGLTRWQFIFGEVEIDSDVEFGDIYSNSLNEAWYKSAVLQHVADGEQKQSFVYSVPHKGPNSTYSSDLKVTASMAIFPKDGGKKAPSCVVGFQFSHQPMYERFMEITSTVNCDDCIKSCGSDEQDCFVIDNNGYIVISEANPEDTGRFFGEIEGTVMEVMVEEKIFNRITVYDYQGLCINKTRGNETKAEEESSSASRELTSPFNFLLLGLKWILTEMIIELSRIKMWAMSMPSADYGDQDYSDPQQQQRETTEKPKQTHHRGKGAEAQEADDYFKARELKRAMTIIRNEYPCDKKVDLYIVNASWVRGENTYSPEKKNSTTEVRPFYVSPIRFSNLLLVVINQMEGEIRQNPLSTKPEIVDIYEVYEKAHPCYKIYMNSLTRRRLTECYTEDPKEEETAYCGKATQIKSTMILFSLSVPLVYLMRF